MSYNSNRISNLSFHRNLIILLIFYSIILQGVLIVFGYFRHHISFNSSEHFAIIFTTRVAMGFMASLFVAYPFVLIIMFLNSVFPWSKSVFKRVALQLVIIVVITSIVSICSDLLVEKLYPAYKIDITSISNDIMIYTVSNVILVILIEAWMFYDSEKKTQQESTILKERLDRMNYETLKNQIEPHFLFNSMSVLSGLIDQEPLVAHKFLLEFTSMYRYIIESLEKPVIKLSAELKFVESYIYLQQHRFGDSLIFIKQIETDIDNYVIPPMSLQVVIENAIKHNIIKSDSPLYIHIYNIQNDIYIKNNIQLKKSIVSSTHIGQRNLICRYELISNRAPVFMEIENSYIGILPILNPDYELSTFAKNYLNDV